nr:unnamed protein product [Digitaria exilis]
MQPIFAEIPLRDRSNDALVVSFVDERGTCSKAVATARSTLYEQLRGDGGGRDQLRMRKDLLEKRRGKGWGAENLVGEKHREPLQHARH